MQTSSRCLIRFIVELTKCTYIKEQKFCFSPLKKHLTRKSTTVSGHLHLSQSSLQRLRRIQMTKYQLYDCTKGSSSWSPLKSIRFTPLRFTQPLNYRRGSVGFHDRNKSQRRKFVLGDALQMLKHISRFPFSIKIYLLRHIQFDTLTLDLLLSVIKHNYSDTRCL